MNWAIEIDGHDFDLADWLETLRPPFDPRVEKLSVAGTEVHALRCARFDDAATSQEVHELGELVVSRLNGAMILLRGGKPVRVGGVLEIRPDGTVGKHVFARLEGIEMRCRVSAVGVVTGPDGQPVPPAPPQPSDAQKWEAAAERDPSASPKELERAELIADLLVHVARCDNWYDVYKTIEFAEKLAGGEHRLKKRMGQDHKSVKAAKTSANFYRHARAKAAELSFVEARNAALFAARYVLENAPTAERQVEAKTRR